MRRTVVAGLVPVCAALALVADPTAAAQERPAGRTGDEEALARKVVSTSVNVRPGDVVVVAGGKHTIPLMEAVAIEAQKAGGMVTMFLNSDRVWRSFNVEVPEEYLDQEPQYFAEWLEHIDVWIGFPGAEDFKAVIADVPEARFAKAAKADQVIWDMLNESKIRSAFVNYPTREDAENVNIDFATLERMHWDAVDTDYESISEKGSRLESLLKGAKTMQVTTPAGTDLSFTVGGRHVFVRDGIVTAEDSGSQLFFDRWISLPGGEVFLAPIETSANGKVVVPRGQCRFEPLTGVSFEFKDGKMEKFEAAEGGECFTDSMAPYTGPKDMFGGISIGLNPALEVIDEGGDFRPSNAAGMVWISVGQNQLSGGANLEPGGFEFPLTGATVTVDGEVVVEDGQLAL